MPSLLSSALLLLLLPSRTVGAAEPASFMGRALAPTMSFHGASWLTRETREREEQPRLLHAALRLTPGEIACDIGAGNGYHTLPMARQVTSSGRAYAVDIQPEMLAMLQERAEAAGLTQVTTVLNGQTDVGLPPGTCDIALMVDVYHEFSDPAAMLRSLREALTPDGELVVVEYREEDPLVPIKPLHKMSKAQVHRELTAHGYKLVRELDTLPWQHAMFYQRDDGPSAAREPVPWSPKKTRRLGR